MIPQNDSDATENLKLHPYTLQLLVNAGLLTLNKPADGGLPYFEPESVELLRTRLGAST
jgi:hypothetical protein